MKTQTSLPILLLPMLFSFLFGQKTTAQDWPALQHFQAANAQLPVPSPQEGRVVFMGNSITIGWLQLRPEFFEGKPYVNRGISGQTTPQMLLRFRQDVIALQPEAVVILAGTNDIAGNTGPITLEQIAGNIRSMVQLAKAHGIRPVVSSVLPAYDYPWRPGLHPDQKIPQLNTLLQQMAQEEGAIYLDYFTAMADARNGLPKAYAHDEVHPTVEGYQAMEPLVEAAIQQALKK
ncbi:MAG: SGNH/GDSL hydrolase family protein [Flavobacteriaceae bacterium]